MESKQTLAAMKKDLETTAAMNMEIEVRIPFGVPFLLSGVPRV